MWQSIQRSVVAVLVLSFGLQSTALAGVIGTEAMLQNTEAQEARAELQAALARDEVRQQLEAHGVDLAQAERRIDALSDEEVLVLAERFDEAPAGGGVLAVLGATFLVLLVLELLGVINVFQGI